MPEPVLKSPPGVIEEQEGVGVVPEPEGLFVGFMPALDWFLKSNSVPAVPIYYYKI